MAVRRRRRADGRALGVGIGAVARNQVLAVIGIVVWFMVIENVVVSVWPQVGRFSPLARETRRDR